MIKKKQELKEEKKWQNLHNFFFNLVKSKKFSIFFFFNPKKVQQILKSRKIQKTKFLIIIN